MSRLDPGTRASCGIQGLVSTSLEGASGLATPPWLAGEVSPELTLRSDHRLLTACLSDDSPISSTSGGRLDSGDNEFTDRLPPAFPRRGERGVCQPHSSWIRPGGLCIPAPLPSVHLWPRLAQPPQSCVHLFPTEVALGRH